jgi:apolipoprotein N-acyltransferase
MAFVNIEGLRVFIVGGTLLLSAYFGLKYLIIGGISAFAAKKSPKFLFLFIPAIWVITDFGLLFGEMSFPWALDGYLLSQFDGISQLASVTGVWGLSFLTVIFAVLLYEAIFEIKLRKYGERKYDIRYYKKFLVLVIIIIIILNWGILRVKPIEFYEEKALVMQPNADQENWDGNISLMQSMDVLDSLFTASTELNRGIYIIPESGIFTYLEFRPFVQMMIENWLKIYDSPIIFGTLDPILDDDGIVISVYNAAFFAEPKNHNNLATFKRYYKQMLVPFVETMPFKGIFPMINRLELGGGRFTAGIENSVWKSGNLSAAPMICYESIYPNFVRKRVNYGADVLVNITNDGWFGRTTAPYQHAEMSRVRAIENGVSIIRCTNSGISFSADPYGKYLAKTQLYTREIVEMPIAKPLKNTIYRKFGDWFAYLCGIFVFFTVIYSIARKK